MNNWSEVFGVEYPECIGCGQCCRFASPSIPMEKIVEKAALNDDFATEFLSIFEPYESVEETRKLNPLLVDKVIAILKKGNNKVSLNQLVFYKCKYLNDDNRCLVYEDRPQLCRNYPDEPYLFFAPGCVFEDWSNKCKEKHKKLQEDLENMKEIRKSISDLVSISETLKEIEVYNNLSEENKTAFLINSRIKPQSYSYLYFKSR